MRNYTFDSDHSRHAVIVSYFMNELTPEGEHNFEFDARFVEHMHEFVNTIKQIERVFVIVGGDADHFKMTRAYDYLADRICAFLSREGVPNMRVITSVCNWDMADDFHAKNSDTQSKVLVDMFKPIINFLASLPTPSWAESVGFGRDGERYAGWELPDCLLVIQLPTHARDTKVRSRRWARSWWP